MIISEDLFFDSILSGGLKVVNIWMLFSVGGKYPFENGTFSLQLLDLIGVTISPPRSSMEQGRSAKCMKSSE